MVDGEYMPIKFKRKVINNSGSLMVNIPFEIAEELGIKKGDTVVISLEDSKFFGEKLEK